MLEHVVRRGLEGGSALVVRAANEPDMEMPIWGSVLLSVTFITAFVFLILVSIHLRRDCPGLC